MIQNRQGFKKKLKLIVKNTVFNFVHKIAIQQLKKIVKNSSPPPKTKKGGKKIIFNLIYGMYGYLIYWESGFAKAMQLRGHDVKVLICGKSLTMCTSEYTIQTVHDDKTCKHCVDFTQDFLKTMGLPHLNIKDYISDEEILKIKEKVNKMTLEECKNFVYKNVPVGGFSINAVTRYFEGAIDIDEKLYESVLRAELINSLIVIDAAEKIIQEEKPDIVFTTHLGYSSWGSFADYCEINGIRVTYPGDGYKKYTIQFDMPLKEKVNIFFKEFRKYRNDEPLNKKEDDELNLFIYKRIHGKEGDTSRYHFQNEDVRDQFDLKKYDRTFAIFPNVVWDSSLLRANKAFKDAYEWISDTIEFFKNHPNYQLILKIHPSEIYAAKSKNTLLDYIFKNYSPLSDNIKIVPPVTNISPYSLFSIIDTGIVYNGTLGLEMALHNVPVIVAGITHYNDFGFTYDVSSKENYYELLSQKLPKLNEEQIKLAKLYGYFYFIKSYVPYKFLYSESFLKKGYNIKSFDELKEGKDKILDKICDYIANNKFYQKW